MNMLWGGGGSRWAKRFFRLVGSSLLCVRPRTLARGTVYLLLVVCPQSSARRGGGDAAGESTLRSGTVNKNTFSFCGSLCVCAVAAYSNRVCVGRWFLGTTAPMSPMRSRVGHRSASTAAL